MNIAGTFSFASTCCLYAQNLATEKQKKISQTGSSSTEIIGIFTLTRNPLGTAEADILTLLNDFCNNLQTAKVTSTSKIL